MTTSDAETIARRFLQVWTAGNLDLVDDLAAPDIVVAYSHFPKPIRGAESFKAALAETYRSFPDIETAADDVFAADDRVAIRWTWRGTHRHGEMFGVEPCGSRVEVRGVSLYRIAGGRVVEESGVADTLGLALQLGAVPAPPADPTGD